MDTLLVCGQMPGSTSPPHPCQRALALGLQGLRKAKQTDSFWANSNPKSLAQHLRGSQGHPSQGDLGDPCAQTHSSRKTEAEKAQVKWWEGAKVSHPREC